MNAMAFVYRSDDPFFTTDDKLRPEVLMERLVCRRAAAVGLHEQNLDGLAAIDVMQLALEAGFVPAETDS